MKKIGLLLLVAWASLLQAQKTYQFPVDSVANVSVSGTSTLHGWTATAATVTDFPQQIELDLAAGEQIDSFAFEVAVASLDGGRGASMNAKITKALLADTHPTINYQQTSPATLEVHEEGGFVLSSTGSLSMAGASKEVQVKATIKETDAGILILSGSKDLKMSDFGITPPSAMFGQIQTDDAITVHFEFVYH